MSNAPAINQKVPAIPEPRPEIAAILIVLKTLKQAIDVLSGRTGSPLDRAVTFSDLVTLGLLTNTARVSSGGVTNLTPVDTSGTVVWANLPVEARNLAPNPMHQGVMVPSELLMLLSFNQRLTLAANMLGTTFVALVNPIGDVLVTVSTYHAGAWAVLGIVTIHSDGTITLPIAPLVVFEIGDAMKFVGPAAVDPYLADFAFAVMFKRI